MWMNVRICLLDGNEFMAPKNALAHRAANKKHVSVQSVDCRIDARVIELIPRSPKMSMLVICGRNRTVREVSKLVQPVARRSFGPLATLNLVGGHGGTRMPATLASILQSTVRETIAHPHAKRVVLLQAGSSR